MKLTLKQILCPLDFSDPSRRALNHAVALARWYGGSITALHVVQLSYPPPALSEYPGPLPLTSKTRDQLLEELRRFVEPAVPAGVTLTAEVRDGNIVGQILKAAQACAADLVVVGTHGLGGFEHLLLGSVAEKVLRKAPCPVLTVPPHAAQEAPEGPVVFERILCPLDFSVSSDRALHFALSLAQEANGRLTLAHVIEGPPESDLKAEYHYAVMDYRRALEREARERLRSAVSDEARVWCEPEEIVATGRPYREILRIAAEKRAQLIVMGVHGRSALDLMLFGSTTNHVVRQATCPVLTIRKG